MGQKKKLHFFSQLIKEVEKSEKAVSSVAGMIYEIKVTYLEEEVEDYAKLRK